MNYQNYLLTYLVFILFCGCNSNSSQNRINNKTKEIELIKSVKKDTISSAILDKEKISSTKNTKIQDLLDKVELLQVPLTYSFEDTFNINAIKETKPLSDEVLDLLSVEKIHNGEYDFRGRLWLSFQLNLSKNFKTLVFSIEDGGSGESVLVNYSNDFKFIDYRSIAYEDYAEGWFSSNSLIEKNRMFLYKDSYTDYPAEYDTICLVIDEYGGIDTLPVEKTTKIDNATVDDTYNNVHESIRAYKKLENILVTEKFLIRIDRLNDKSYRYASWSKNQKVSEKPDLVLLKGEYLREGTGGNYSYEFSNGNYLYRCSFQPLRESQAPPAVLRVYKDDEEILYQPAEIIK